MRWWNCFVVVAGMCVCFAGSVGIVVIVCLRGMRVSFLDPRTKCTLRACDEWVAGELTIGVWALYICHFVLAKRADSVSVVDTCVSIKNC